MISSARCGSTDDSRRSRDYGIQGFSVGRYESNALLVETTHYVFDVTGFDDYNGIPSSQQKKVTERYWRDGNQLKATVTVEDPMFLRKPASYTMRWLPAPKGYKLQALIAIPKRHGCRCSSYAEIQMRRSRVKSAKEGFLMTRGLRLSVASVLTVGFLLTVAPIVAHHSAAAAYDQSKRVEAQGTVNEKSS